MLVWRTYFSSTMSISYQSAHHFINAADAKQIATSNKEIVRVQTRKRMTIRIQVAFTVCLQTSQKAVRDISRDKQSRNGFTPLVSHPFSEVPPWKEFWIRIWHQAWAQSDGPWSCILNINLALQILPTARQGKFAICSAGFQNSRA